MKIDNYNFGKIVIDGKKYTNDVIIFPNRVKSNWWRKRGHYLQIEDLGEVFTAKPDKLIIGQGYNGLMAISKKVLEKAKNTGIEVIPLDSTNACERFNQEVGNAVLAIHLTC